MVLVVAVVIAGVAWALAKQRGQAQERETWADLERDLAAFGVPAGYVSLGAERQGGGCTPLSWTCEPLSVVTRYAALPAPTGVCQDLLDLLQPAGDVVELGAASRRPGPGCAFRVRMAGATVVAIVMTPEEFGSSSSERSAPPGYRSRLVLAAHD